MHVYSNTYILINKTCNLCTAYYVQYWLPTRELPLQFPWHKALWKRTSGCGGVQAHTVDCHSPHPECPMYMYPIDPLQCAILTT